MEIGSRIRAIPEGDIPPFTTGEGGRPLESHEIACLLNACDADVHVELTLYFRDREPESALMTTVAFPAGP